jgi:uncharacterized protein with HEPN domain
MSEERLLEYLEHRRQACADARAFVDGMNRTDFIADKRTQQAVIMSLVILGEVATKIMDRHPEFAAQHPVLPLRNIRGMRNRIAHGYFDINLDVVWETVQSALPTLLHQLKAITDAK